MKLYLTIISLFFLYVCSFGQETIISSETSSITINNKTIIVSDNDLDFSLPFSLLYPTFDEKRSFVSTVNQINLIGKLNFPENIGQILINDEETEFTEKGLFFKVIDLSEGKNDLYIKVTPKYGKIIIVKFVLDYQL
ncbi:MAG: hypothetical protein U9N53_00325 [Bacteroidota bacterium]|nr:hypothetical protein [Bacteroidota bacterium]